MKRIILSILGGIIFPILFAVLGIFISEIVFPQHNLDRMMVKGMPAPGVAFITIGIPFWIYNYIQFYHFFGFRMILDTVWFRVILILGFNFLLYAGLTYLFLWYFGLFKKSKVDNYTDPPSPPEF